jgi:hypothetical protein
MRSIAILPFGQACPRIDKISNMVGDQQTIIRLHVMAVLIVPRGIFPSGWIAKERM